MLRIRQPWPSQVQTREPIIVKEACLQTTWQSLFTDWDIPLWVTGALVATSFIYVRGWRALRRTRPQTLPAWRLWAFLSGLFAIFTAVSSPLDTFSETLLFMHMAQHFVLMSVAPPLIVLGAPFVPMLRGLPRPIVQSLGGFLFRSPLVSSLRRLFSRLWFAWLAMNATYLGWHIPKAYEFALASEKWHNFEHLTFLLTGILFWWPILRPWPTRSRFNAWTIIPYLLTSDIVNTGLSASLCFSGRLLYPSYAVADRPFGLDALKDQIAAGAFMWVFGSVVFLIPAIYLTAQLLANGRLLDEKAGLERVRAMVE